MSPTKPHWTEYLDNDAESTDRDDDWEWDRQDDFGDPWDRDVISKYIFDIFSQSYFDTLAVASATHLS